SAAHVLITSYSSPSSTQEKSLCDYTKGRWVRDEMGPLYNGSSCGTIKDGQNCLRHDMADQILVIFIGNGNRTNAIYRDSTLTGFLIL
ncbi:BnaUnng04750D, partial [Brassica napus]